jgi:hypothetical protein
MMACLHVSPSARVSVGGDVTGTKFGLLHLQEHVSAQSIAARRKKLTAFEIVCSLVCYNLECVRINIGMKGDFKQHRNPFNSHGIPLCLQKELLL